MTKMPDNVVDFTRCHRLKSGTRKSNLTISRLENVSDVDDPLCDPDVHRLMKQWHTSGVFRSMLSVDAREPRGVISHTFAEQSMPEASLKMYGCYTPFRGVNTPMTSHYASSTLFTKLAHDAVLRRIYNIIACSWWHCRPLSEGLIQMLIGNQSNRLRREVRDAINFFEESASITMTGDFMDQPVMPPTIRFSKRENQVFWATREALYNDFENAIFAVNALQGMYQAHIGCMTRWTTQTWPSLRSKTSWPQNIQGAVQ